MRITRSMLVGVLSAASFAGLGCHGVHGKPGPDPEVPRPDQVLDFATLYKQNCVACHGTKLEAGAAISLSNPVYLAVAGEENIKSVLNHGVPGKLMPAFTQSGGGMLSSQQVAILAHGLVQTWGKPDALGGVTAPRYRALSRGDAAMGAKVFATNCAECHGASGEGSDEVKGAIVDPAFLALISDQNLRSFVIGGVPEKMPDWKSHSDKPMTDAEITDVVAWLASHREAMPGIESATANVVPSSAVSFNSSAASSVAKTHKEPHS